jgi:phasin family protein
MKSKKQTISKPIRGRRTLPAGAPGAKKRTAPAGAAPSAAIAAAAPSAPPPAVLPSRVAGTPERAARSPGATGGYGHGAFEAMVRSGAIVAEGLGGIGQAWIGLAQAAMHDGAATARAIIGAKSAQQVLELQANYARATLDRLVAESSKLSALSVGVANRAAEPIQSQMAAAVERLWRRAA